MTTNIAQKLNDALGKAIDKICPNNFHNLRENHCAHFVSHMCDLQFRFNCQHYKGGNHPGGNIRVHEIFARCPLVGKWQDRPSTDDPLLVFVTAKQNVDLVNKTMINVPQKHIGVFLNGQIFHYSNTPDKVVAWSDTKFLETFQQVYSGDQGLFFGTVPGLDLHLRVDDNPTENHSQQTFTLRRDDRKWFAAERSDGGNEFFVGRETSNNNYIGLMMRVSDYYGPTYKGADYEHLYGHWANLLELTGYCESKNHFNMINTYDSAKFTFGFYQMGAHTPKKNLIRFFHHLSAQPGFSEYFPELQIIDGRLHRVDEDGGKTDLEEVMATGPRGRRQLQLFMNYLNAFRRSHDEQEVLQSARLIHWSNTSRDMRDLQVKFAYETLEKNMSDYAELFDLNAKSDLICALVADIRHQGRAKNVRIEAALRSSDPVESLITINAGYTGRIADLRDIIAKMQGEGRLGNKIYSSALNVFL